MIVPYVDPEEQGKQVKLSNVPEEYTHETLEDLHQAVKLDVESLVEAKFLAPDSTTGSCTVLLRYTDRDSARKAVHVLSGKPAMMSTGELKKLSAQLDRGYQDPILPSVLVSEVPLAYDETVLRGIHLQFDLDSKHVISFKFLPSKDDQTTSCIIRYCDTEAANIAIKNLTGRPVLTRAGEKKSLMAEFAKFADTKQQGLSRSKARSGSDSSSGSSRRRRTKNKRSRSKRSKKRSLSRRRSKSRRRSRRRSKSRKRSRSRKKSRSRRRSKSRKRSRSKNKRRSHSRSKRKKSSSSISRARKRKSRSRSRLNRNGKKMASSAARKATAPQSFDSASEASVLKYIKASGLDLHTSKLFQDLSVDAKQYVMDQGTLEAFHQPAAELYGRVRQHLQNSTGKQSLEQEPLTQSQSVSYLDISNFIKESCLDATTEEAFRNQPVEVQMQVIGKGSVAGTEDSNALVKARIRESQQDLFAQAAGKTQSNARSEMPSADLEAMEALLPKDEKERQEVLAQQPADVREELQRFMAARELEQALLRADESFLQKCLTEARKFKVAQAQIIAAEGMLNSLRRYGVGHQEPLSGTASGLIPVPKSGTVKSKLAVSKSGAKAPQAPHRLEPGPSENGEGHAQPTVRLLEPAGVWQEPDVAESWPDATNDTAAAEEAPYIDIKHGMDASKSYDDWSSEEAEKRQNNSHDTWDDEEYSGNNQELKSQGVEEYSSSPWREDRANKPPTWSETDSWAKQDPNKDCPHADHGSWDIEEKDGQADQGTWQRRPSDWDASAGSWKTDCTKDANNDVWQRDNSWSAGTYNDWNSKDTQDHNDWDSKDARDNALTASEQNDQQQEQTAEAWKAGDEGEPHGNDYHAESGADHDSPQRPSSAPSSKLKVAPTVKLTPVAKWAPKARYTANVGDTHVTGSSGEDNEKNEEKSKRSHPAGARPPSHPPWALRNDSAGNHPSPPPKPPWAMKGDSASNGVAQPPMPPRRTPEAPRIPPKMPNQMPPSALDIQAMTVTGGKSGWEDKAFRTFQENGFVIVKGALKTLQCEALLQECSRVASKAKNSPRFSLGDVGSKGTLLHLPVFARHLLCGAGAKLRPLLNRIFENEEGGALRFSCISGNAIGVQAGTNTYEELSSDARLPYAEGYFPPPLVAVDCCIEALADNGGAPRLIAGSHVKREEVPNPEPGEWKRSRVSPLPQGAAIVRDSRLLRGGTPNLSDQMLLLPCIEYASDEFLTGPDFDEANFPSMRCLPQKIFEKMPPQIQELCVEIVSE